MSSTAPQVKTAVSPVALATTGQEARRLLTLAAPMIGAMVSRMAMGFIDFWMVHYLGTDATAAISPATIFVFTVLCLGMGAATSIQTFAAQALGRREHREAAAYAWHGFYIAAIFVVLSLPATLLTEPFWKLMDQPPAVSPLQVAYCEIAFWCMGFSIVCASLDGFFNGVQKPSVCLLSILVSLVFNVVANYCLIFGKWGFPELGIRGAAVATVIAWGVRAAMLTAVFLSHEFDRTYGSRTAWRFEIERMKAILRLGGPIAVHWVLDIGAWFVFLTPMMGRFGTKVMAASNVGIQLMHASFMPAIGLGMAICSLVGHAVGQGQPDLAVRRVRVGMLMTGAYMGVVGLVFLLAGAPLMRLFSEDPDVIRFGTGVLIWAAIFQVFDAAGITYVNALRGAGDTRWPAMLVAGHCWIVFIGGGYLISRLLPEWGFHGPWMMCTLYIILLGLALWRRFAQGAWRKIDLFKDRPALDVEGACALEAAPGVSPRAGELDVGSAARSTADNG